VLSQIVLTGRVVTMDALLTNAGSADDCDRVTMS